MFDLTNKVAVVIGGAGGLGEACALAMAKQGAKVVVASRNVEKLQNVTVKIKNETGADAVAMPVDVTNEESIQQLASEVITKFHTIDILVNAQGINFKFPALEIDATRWDTIFATNVRGVVLTCKHFGKYMVEKKQGKIINLSSVRGVRGVGGGNVAYGATKGAVDMITKMLAVEWAEHHVNVNAIGPSIVLTEGMKKATTMERLEYLKSRTLFKRFVTPESVAAACVYLASSEADDVTGAIMYVDGGLTAVG